MSSSPIETDERFWVLSEALASYAGDPDDPLTLEGHSLQASVALVLRAREPLELLLIKRATSDRDPWSGHMALPGGRRDGSDPNLTYTARRETMEETGVDLTDGASPLGRLDPVTPSTNRIPALTISPFVFGVSGAVTARVASPEVEQVFWVTLDELRAPESHGSVEISLPGGPHAFPCYHLPAGPVWGLTYRILQQFLEVFTDAELARLRGKKAPVPPGA